ncbi:MAG: DNA repair protein RecO [Spirochaetales bacterium]|jgi:DNA repair protein RecO (recombination protein O)|nr:DNA repair protein RecO [Spirochaetales bacterium]
MSRNFQTAGIVLKNNRFGEIHKGVILLSPEHGLLSAVAYGACSAKGKLRSVTNPLCAGTFFLYRDPVKDSIKITDMDCRDFFEGVRSGIVKFFTASVWLEIILKTFGGDAEETFSLLLESLRLLDACTEDSASRFLVQFLWRYLELAGAAPATDVCAGCGETRSENQGLVYYRGASGFFCRECAASSRESVFLSAGALGCLRYSRGLPLEKAAACSPDAASFAALKKAMLFLAEDFAGGPLNSIRTGKGIL